MPVGHPNGAFIVDAQREMVETARRAEVWLRLSALGPLATLRQRRALAGLQLIVWVDVF
jgi:hypothetical protein